MKKIIVYGLKLIIVCYAMAIAKDIIVLALVYSAIAKIVQTLLNRGFKAPKFVDFLLSHKLFTEVDGVYTAKTPLSLLKKVFMWFISDHILPKKWRAKLDEMKTKANDEV